MHSFNFKEEYADDFKKSPDFDERERLFVIVFDNKKGIYGKKADSFKVWDNLTLKEKIKKFCDVAQELYNIISIDHPKHYILFVAREYCITPKNGRSLEYGQREYFKNMFLALTQKVGNEETAYILLNISIF